MILLSMTLFLAPPYAISNTVGFSMLSGGSLRYRLYQQHGLDGTEITELTSFSAIGFGLAVVTLGALASLFEPKLSDAALHVGTNLIFAMASLLLLV